MDIDPTVWHPDKNCKESVESQITSRVLYQIKVVFFQLCLDTFVHFEQRFGVLDLTQVSCFNGIKDMHFRTRDVGGWYQLVAFTTMRRLWLLLLRLLASWSCDWNLEPHNPLKA